MIKKVRKIINAYSTGEFGEIVFPEGTHPKFENKEMNISYFTLPMALNYQRDSYKIWGFAKKTYEDKETNWVFKVSSDVNEDELRKALMKYKLALQPNNHVKIWKTISQTVKENFGTFENLIKESDNDFLKLKEIIQNKYKKGFPYLSGPKIFNYWSFILSKDVGIQLKNRSYIEIAPDTHVIKASVILNVITKDEANKISKENLSKKWRELLNGSGIDPIDVHEPLWFWSKSGFKFNPE